MARVNRDFLWRQGLLMVGCGLIFSACGTMSRPSVPLDSTPVEWAYDDSVGEVTSSHRRPQAIAQLPSVVALAYYGFAESVDSPLTTTPELFRQQVEYLKLQNFSFFDLAQWKASERQILGNQQILLTLEGWSPGHPEILKEAQTQRIPLVIFLNSKDLLNPEAKSYLIANRNNPLITFGLRGSQLTQSLKQETKELGKLLGQPPKVYSYPAGEDPSMLKSTVKDLGYQLAMTHLSGAVGRETDPLMWPRFPLNNRHGQLLGPQKNGFEIRAFALPLELKSLEAKEFFSTNKLFIGITTQIHDARRLNCFFNGSPVARIMRTAQHKHFAASTKNWGHRYEISLKEKPKGPPVLRCTLLGQPGNSSLPPRFHWGTVRIPSVEPR
ncbi:MAG: hypothetical protein KDD43_01350 [Bdellovibrionales bacterium]|nr:hypothetical protein [Bdellovibrionales bacterium]